MTVSVRMDALLEKELEQAAKRQGITKSQFIITAVERALGRKDPYELYLKVMEEAASYPVSVSAEPPELAPHKQAIRDKLRAKHAQESADYEAFLAARKPESGAAQ